MEINLIFTCGRDEVDISRVKGEKLFLSDLPLKIILPLGVMGWFGLLLSFFFKECKRRKEGWGGSENLF